MQVLKKYIRPVSLFLLAAYFMFAAVVQFNDPDPLHWMMLYAASALVCLLATRWRDVHVFAFLVAGMALTEMAITFEGFASWWRAGQENVIASPMSAAKPYIELTREFLGAAISLAVMLWLGLTQRKTTG